MPRNRQRKTANRAVANAVHSLLGLVTTESDISVGSLKPDLIDFIPVRDHAGNYTMTSIIGVVLNKDRSIRDRSPDIDQDNFDQWSKQFKRFEQESKKVGRRQVDLREEGECASRDASTKWLDAFVNEAGSFGERLLNSLHDTDFKAETLIHTFQKQVMAQYAKRLSDFQDELTLSAEQCGISLGKPDDESRNAAFDRWGKAPPGTDDSAQLEFLDVCSRELFSIRYESKIREARDRLNDVRMRCAIRSMDRDSLRNVIQVNRRYLDSKEKMTTAFHKKVDLLERELELLSIPSSSYKDFNQLRGLVKLLRHGAHDFSDVASVAVAMVPVSATAFTKQELDRMSRETTQKQDFQGEVYTSFLKDLLGEEISKSTVAADESDPEGQEYHAVNNPFFELSRMEKPDAISSLTQRFFEASARARRRNPQDTVAQRAVGISAERAWNSGLADQGEQVARRAGTSTAAASHRESGGPSGTGSVEASYNGKTRSQLEAPSTDRSLMGLMSMETLHKLFGEKRPPLLPSWKWRQRRLYGPYSMSKVGKASDVALGEAANSIATSTWNPALAPGGGNFDAEFPPLQYDAFAVDRTQTDEEGINDDAEILSVAGSERYWAESVMPQGEHANQSPGTGRSSDLLLPTLETDDEGFLLDRGGKRFASDDIDIVYNPPIADGDLLTMVENALISIVERRREKESETNPQSALDQVTFGSPAT
ncbi:hypothetical protein BD324DRAFT_650679 [Kockovaella imperatae]|uniref:Uncharacterized protein n=1 Tax=Kockovaella imperatae TaxID=4999 RepID=A0A1Y1UHU8_9TREE|nr:hypothetical protein BD324DRAFT_650679 [Kockovaella imperatae]ORX37066.1 hypothetical protein BD324DRAFT_650679 [Kockovaella imperatae]